MLAVSVIRFPDYLPGGSMKQGSVKLNKMLHAFVSKGRQLMPFPSYEKRRLKTTTFVSGRLRTL